MFQSPARSASAMPRAGNRRGTDFVKLFLLRTSTRKRCSPFLQRMQGVLSSRVSKSAAVANARITAANEIKTLRTVDAVRCLSRCDPTPKHQSKFCRCHLIGRDFASDATSLNDDESVG